MHKMITKNILALLIIMAFQSQSFATSGGVTPGTFPSSSNSNSLKAEQDVDVDQSQGQLQGQAQAMSQGQGQLQGQTSTNNNNNANHNANSNANQNSNANNNALNSQNTNANANMNTNNVKNSNDVNNSVSNSNDLSVKSSNTNTNAATSKSDSASVSLSDSKSISNSQNSNTNNTTATGGKSTSKSDSTSNATGGNATGGSSVSNSTSQGGAGGAGGNATAQGGASNAQGGTANSTSGDSTSQSNNQSSVVVENHGDTTSIKYDYAASSAASALAGPCTNALSAQTKTLGMSAGSVTAQCRFLMQADAELNMAKELIKLIDSGVTLKRLNKVSLLIKSIDTKMQTLTKAYTESSSANQQEISDEPQITKAEYKRQMKILTAQRKDLVNTQSGWDEYIVSSESDILLHMQNFEKHMKRANFNVRWTSLTGFVATISSDLAIPLGFSLFIK